MKRRNDIQGLRALAVILVILCHLEFQNNAFRGGYIGVDVFFVISGYIITSLLIREYSRNADANSGYGWISLRSFYFRRVKRIIPVASIVLITTVSSSYFLFNSVKAGWIRTDGLFASIFLANVNLIQQKTDYFSQSISQSPLEHYWSLSVEEQFYLLIPFLIILAVSVHGISIGNFKLWWERRVFILLGTITLCSFVWSLVQTSNNPQSSYFSTLTRAWEIGAGGLLALVTFQRNSELSKKSANFIAISSLLVLITSSFVFDENSRFPGYLALVPVCATSILIFVCGTNPLNIISKLLSLRQIVFIGEISFSLYLWHLPVIVILNDYFKFVSNSSLRSALLLAITFVLALMTYHFVEKPCRDYPIPASWESIHRSSDLGQPKMSIFFENNKVRRALIGLLCFGFLIGGYKTSASIIYQRPTDPPPVNLDFSSQIGSGENTFEISNGLPMAPEGEISNNSGSSYAADLTLWKQKILSSVGNLSTRNLSPTFELTANKDVFKNPDCGIPLKITGINVKQLNTCVITGGSKYAVFIGNSHARMLQYTVSRSLKLHGYSTYSVSVGSCLVANVTPVVNSKPSQYCDDYRKAVEAILIKLKPQVLVISEASVETSKNFLPPGVIAINEKSSNKVLFWSEYKKALINLKQYTKNLIVIGESPMLTENIADCVDAIGNFSPECSGNPTNITDGVEAARNAVGFANGNFIDIREWLCTPTTCPPIIGNTLVYTDQSHLSYPIQAKLLPLFDAYISSLGL